MLTTSCAGFRCCYCYHMNEARKQRPRAPSLSEHDVSLTCPASQAGNITVSLTGTKLTLKVKKNISCVVIKEAKTDK